MCFRTQVVRALPIAGPGDGLAPCRAAPLLRPETHQRRRSLATHTIVPIPLSIRGRQYSFCRSHSVQKIPPTLRHTKPSPSQQQAPMRTSSSLGRTSRVSAPVPRLRIARAPAARTAPRQGGRAPRAAPLDGASIQSLADVPREALAAAGAALLALLGAAGAVMGQQQSSQGGAGSAAAGAAGAQAAGAAQLPREDAVLVLGATGRSGRLVVQQVQ
jgi:hypothetical protein